MHEWARKKDPTFSFAFCRQLMLCRHNSGTGLDPSAEPSWSCKLVEGSSICCLAFVRTSQPFVKMRTASALLVCWHATCTGQACFFWDNFVDWGLSTHSEQRQLYRHTELVKATWVLDSTCSRHSAQLPHAETSGHCKLTSLMTSLILFENSWDLTSAVLKYKAYTLLCCLYCFHFWSVLSTNHQFDFTSDKYLLPFLTI